MPGADFLPAWQDGDLQTKFDFKESKNVWCFWHTHIYGIWVTAVLYFFGERVAGSPISVIFQGTLLLGFVDLKQIGCQVFLQQRWVYLGSAEDCSSGSTNMVSHVKISVLQGKMNVFYREEKEGGRAVVNRVHGISLAESLPAKKSLSSSC